MCAHARAHACTRMRLCVRIPACVRIRPRTSTRAPRRAGLPPTHTHIHACINACKHTASVCLLALLSPSCIPPGYMTMSREGTKSFDSSAKTISSLWNANSPAAAGCPAQPAGPHAGITPACFSCAALTTRMPAPTAGPARYVVFVVRRFFFAPVASGTPAGMPAACSSRLYDIHARMRASG